MKLVSAALVLVFVALSHSYREPGLKIRLSQPGFQYAANVATQILTQQIQTLNIPDQSGSAHVSVGDVDYTISNIRVTSFNPPTTTVTTQPFRWTLVGTSASLEADWKYQYRLGFIKVSDHGSMDVAISLNLDTTIGLGVDNTGRPKIFSQSCQSDITHVDVHFHGGASWLYNLFDDNVEDAIRDSLSGQICNSVVDEIAKAETQLQNMAIELYFQDKVVLDYSLVSPPNLTKDFIDFPSKGEFYWKTDKQEYPIAPKPTPSPPDSRMLAFWITEYTINSLGYTEYKHGALVYNLTQADLPESSRYVLDTTCKSLFKPCIGGIVPKIGDLYPNTSVFLDMTVTQAPVMHVDPSGISGEWVGIVGYNVQPKGSGVKFLFSTVTKVFFNINVTMKGIKVMANVTDFKVNMTLDRSNIGTVPVDNLNVVMDLAIKLFIIPQLNTLGTQGIDLPAINDVDYLNPTLKLFNNSLYVGVDLKYDPNSQ